jgi:TfoX/Sxy family transcriptional regulator of competence genes
VAYDEVLADRVRELLSARSEVSERSMFGSLCFLVGGNLAVCARKEGELLVRLAPEDAERADAETGVRVAEMGPRKRVMKGWVFVSPERLADDAGLAEWVEAGADYASSLPAKESSRLRPAGCCT